MFQYKNTVRGVLLPMEVLTLSLLCVLAEWDQKRDGATTAWERDAGLQTQAGRRQDQTHVGREEQGEGGGEGSPWPGQTTDCSGNHLMLNGGTEDRVRERGLIRHWGKAVSQLEFSHDCHAPWQHFTFFFKRIVWTKPPTTGLKSFSPHTVCHNQKYISRKSLKLYY